MCHFSPKKIKIGDIACPEVHLIRTYNNGSYSVCSLATHIWTWRLEAATTLVNIVDQSLFRSSQPSAIFPLFVVKSVRVSAVEATYTASAFSPFEVRFHNISRP